MTDQTSQLYKSEAFLRKPPYLFRFEDWLAAQIWIDKAVSSAFWRKHSSLRRVYLVPNKYDKKKWMTGGVPVDGRRVGVISHPRRTSLRPRLDAVQHELVHVALGHTEEITNAESHGPDFARLDLAFVRHFFGKEAEAELKARFLKWGVEF